MNASEPRQKKHACMEPSMNASEPRQKNHACMEPSMNASEPREKKHACMESSMEPSGPDAYYKPYQFSSVQLLCSICNVRTPSRPQAAYAIGGLTCHSIQAKEA